MRFEVTGSNAEWASLPDDGFAVPADATVNFTVVVRAPADAVHGERADLILQGYPTKNPTARGLLRLVAIVDTSEDSPRRGEDCRRPRQVEGHAGAGFRAPGVGLGRVGLGPAAPLEVAAPGTSRGRGKAGTKRGWRDGRRRPHPPRFRALGATYARHLP